MDKNNIYIYDFTQHYPPIKRKIEDIKKIAEKEHFKRLTVSVVKSKEYMYIHHYFLSQKKVITGNCGICNERYTDLYQHLKTKKHEEKNLIDQKSTDLEFLLAKINVEEGTLSFNLGGKFNEKEEVKQWLWL